MLLAEITHSSRVVPRKTFSVPEILIPSDATWILMRHYSGKMLLAEITHISRIIPWKSLSFLESLRAQHLSRITRTISQEATVWVLVWVSSFYGDGGGSRTVNYKGPFRTKTTTEPESVVFWWHRRSFSLSVPFTCVFDWKKQGISQPSP